MAMFELEHSKKAYVTDFAVMAACIVTLLALLLGDTPPSRWWMMLGYVAIGGVLWTPLEYALHRFVLHGVLPFKAWHQLHHDRPRAFIYTPTLFVILAFAVLAYLPLWALAGTWVAVALTLGLMSGYWFFGIAHHALHHWRLTNAWFVQQKIRHARHHAAKTTGVCFGVTTSLWDRVFGSEKQPAKIA